MDEVTELTFQDHGATVYLRLEEEPTGEAAAVALGGASPVRYLFWSITVNGAPGHRIDGTLLVPAPLRRCELMDYYQQAKLAGLLTVPRREVVWAIECASCGGVRVIRPREPGEQRFTRIGKVLCPCGAELHLDSNEAFLYDRVYHRHVSIEELEPDE